MSFFWINLIFLAISLIAYGFFNGGVQARYNENRKGTIYINTSEKSANYLPNKQQRWRCEYGSLYYFNWLFLIGLAAFVLVFAFSWIKWMQTPVVVVGIVLGLIEIPALMNSLIWKNREKYGKPFVFIKTADIDEYHYKSLGSCLGLLDWLSCLIPLLTYIFLLAEFL